MIIILCVPYYVTKLIPGLKEVNLFSVEQIRGGVIAVFKIRAVLK